MRVLLVDDDHDTTSAFAALLEFSGCATRVVNRGSDAMAAADEFLPHMVLLDLAMPDMDGYCVAEHLRRNPKLQQTTIIVISGYLIDWPRAKAVGIDRHFMKPLDWPTLAKELCQPPRCSERPALEAAHLPTAT